MAWSREGERGPFLVTGVVGLYAVVALDVLVAVVDFCRCCWMFWVPLLLGAGCFGCRCRCEVVFGLVLGAEVVGLSSVVALDVLGASVANPASREQIGTPSSQYCCQ